jgi:hypothetical protein
MLRFLGGHLLVGTLATAVVLAALLATDTFGLASLAGRDPAGGVAIGLLAFGFWVTFGSLALGAGIMGLGEGRRPGGGNRPWPMTAPQPLPIRVRSGSRSSR